MIENSEFKLNKLESLKTGSVSALTGGTSVITLEENKINIAADTVTFTESGVTGLLVNEKYGNIYVGTGSGGADSINANANTIYGIDAASNLDSGDDNVAIGYNALNDNQDGKESVAIGSSALAVCESYYNTAVGFQSLYLSTLGERNTTVGQRTGYNLTLGDRNTFVGSAAGSGVVTGSDNVCIGETTDDATAESSDNNGCITIGADANCIGSLTDAICIGHDSENKESNTCVIGNDNLIKIKPGSDIICDLGDIDNGFKDIYSIGTVYCDDVACETIKSKQPVLNYAKNLTDGVLINDASGDTSLIPDPFVGSRIIPANTVVAGDTYQVKIKGSITGYVGGTITFTGFLGGETLFTYEYDPNDVAGFFDLSILFNFVDLTDPTASNTVVCLDIEQYQADSGLPRHFGTITTATIDTTIDRTLDVFALISAANATNLQSFYFSFSKI